MSEFEFSFSESTLGGDSMELHTFYNSAANPSNPQPPRVTDRAGQPSSRGWETMNTLAESSTASAFPSTPSPSPGRYRSNRARTVNAYVPRGSPVSELYEAFDPPETDSSELSQLTHRLDWPLPPLPIQMGPAISNASHHDLEQGPPVRPLPRSFPVADLNAELKERKWERKAKILLGVGILVVTMTLFTFGSLTVGPFKDKLRGNH